MDFVTMTKNYFFILGQQSFKVESSQIIQHKAEIL